MKENIHVYILVGYKYNKNLYEDISGNLIRINEIN